MEHFISRCAQEDMASSSTKYGGSHMSRMAHIEARYGGQDRASHALRAVAREAEADEVLVDAIKHGLGQQTTPIADSGLLDWTATSRLEGPCPRCAVRRLH
jgi:hypothetical protein